MKSEIPPLPTPPTAKTPPLPQPRKLPTMLIVLGAIAALLFSLVVIVLIGQLLFSIIQPSSTSASMEAWAPSEVTEYDPLANPVFSSAQDEEYYNQYVDAENDQLRLPDSDITIDLPPLSRFDFAYDDERQLLTMNLETADGLSVSITSNKMDTTPYTRTEAEEFEKAGVFTDIQGGEEQYYYVVTKGGVNSSGNIVDCLASRNTSIVVFNRQEAGGSASGDASAYHELLALLESTHLKS